MDFQSDQNIKHPKGFLKKLNYSETKRAILLTGVRTAVIRPWQESHLRSAGLVPNWERSTSRLYIVTLFI